MIRTLVILTAVLVFAVGCQDTAASEEPMTASSVTVERTDFGKLPDGTPIDLFTIANRHGVSVSLMTYGGIATNISAPDRAGRSERITLGFDTLEEYLAGHPYFGCITGRYCNRIAYGKFTLDGKQYTLKTNNGEHHLHGGEKGFDKRVWRATIIHSDESAGVAFTYTSPDGEEGYPGNLTTKVSYLLNDNNELRIDYEAVTDKTTHVNLTHHSYWNLAGPGGSVLDHVLEIHASKYTPGDATLIPTGKIDPVAGTDLDFTKPTAIGARIDKVEGGYDHNYVVDGEAGTLRPHAELYDPESGRVLEVASTEPGCQFYSGNFLDGVKGAGGKIYDKHGGCCLEPQHYPDSPNKPSFPSTVLRPGERYETTTVFRFTTR